MIILIELFKTIVANWRAVLIFAAGFVLGAWLFHRAEPAPIVPPAIVAHSSTTRSIDTIILRDTIRRPIPSSRIKATVHDTVYASPTGDDLVYDSVACYHATERFADSASVGITVCSKELPLVRPLDLSMHIDYLPPPQKSHYEYHSDTATLQLPPIKQPSRFWFGVEVAGITVGVTTVALGTLYLLR